MALHNLVTFKHRLTQAVDSGPAVNELIQLRDRIANVRFQVSELSDEDSKYLDQLVAYYNNLIDQVHRPVESVTEHLTQVTDKINTLTQQLFAGNYELEKLYGTVDSVRNNRRIYVREDVEDAVKQRILLHTSWRYPALEIGCRDGEWTQFLVAADPLYIMDRHEEFIASTAGKFPEMYQRRLRQYLLVDHDLSQLPQAQIAFVFSWGYFNYVSIDTMHQYLRQIFALLRPGGTFMFSYNDGDTPAGAGMAENFAQSYMPKSMLKPLCESLGFDIAAEFDVEPNISWLEIKRPGELATIKAHQVLGEIKPITL